METPGAAHAREALTQEAEASRRQVELAGETIGILRSEMRLMRDQLRSDMAQGIHDGIAQAVADPEITAAFFAAGLQTMRQQARNAAGEAVLTGLTAGGKRLLWAAAFFLGFLYFAGWDGVKLLGATFLRVLTKG